MQFLAALAVVTLASFPLADAADIKPPAVHNFHQVDAHLYRGGQPDAKGFKDLARIGVRTIIDLRSAVNQRKEKKLVEAAGMHYVNVPMSGMRAPSDEQIATVFKIIDDPTAWPIFVHCKRGADRTGTVIACYRIAHDRWDNRKALEEARYDGMRWIERAMMRYILTFQPPAAASAPKSLVPAAVTP